MLFTAVQRHSPQLPDNDVKHVKSWLTMGLQLKKLTKLACLTAASGMLWTGMIYITCGATQPARRSQ